MIRPAVDDGDDVIDFVAGLAADHAPVAVALHDGAMESIAGRLDALDAERDRATERAADDA